MFAPRSTKEVAYKTLVRPQLEYAAPMWSPYFKTQIQQLDGEDIRMVAHWTCGRWSNTSSNKENSFPICTLIWRPEWTHLEEGWQVIDC